MKCPNCGKLLPDDSEFCTYCGKEIKDVDKEPMDKQTPSKKRSSITNIICILLCIAFGISSLFIYQNDRKKISELNKRIEVTSKEIDDKKQKVSDLESRLESVSNLESELESSKEEVTKLNSRLNDYMSDAHDFQRLCEIDDEPIGYASSKFFVNNGVVILDGRNDEAYITLTCDYDSYVEIGCDQLFKGVSGYAATLDFTEDSWTGNKTKLKASGALKRGTTVYRLSNNKDKSTFLVIIITK